MLKTNKKASRSYRYININNIFANDSFIAQELTVIVF